MGLENKNPRAHQTWEEFPLTSPELKVGDVLTARYSERDPDTNLLEEFIARGLVVTEATPENLTLLQEGMDYPGVSRKLLIKREPQAGVWFLNGEAYSTTVNINLYKGYVPY